MVGPWVGANWNNGSSGGFGQFNGNNYNLGSANYNGSGRLASQGEGKITRIPMKDRMSLYNQSAASWLIGRGAARFFMP